MTGSSSEDRPVWALAVLLLAMMASLERVPEIDLLLAGIAAGVEREGVNFRLPG